MISFKCKVFSCEDCKALIDFPLDSKVGEIISCPSCGAEYEVKKNSKYGYAVEYLQLEGVDYGE